MTNEQTKQDKRMVSFFNELKGALKETPELFEFPGIEFNISAELGNLVDLILSDVEYRAAFLSLAVTYAIRDAAFQRRLVAGMLACNTMTKMFELLDEAKEKNGE